ncbi:MAG: hypothetical protein MI864_17075 [Pseudomonadales bacterium]|nr:hypothetical protein [Pseudomonadales bacterium]
MEKIEATIIVRDTHLDTVEGLFISTDIEINVLEVIQDNDTVVCQVDELGPHNDLRLNVIFDHLRQQGVSYSYFWHDPSCKQGGESHYRSNGQEEQYLSWMDYEKNVVSIEDVRQAITQGDIAVLELLEVTENNFTPWDWSEVAA